VITLEQNRWVNVSHHSNDFLIGHSTLWTTSYHWLEFHFLHTRALSGIC
jgi:hypothetical protein